MGIAGSLIKFVALPAIAIVALGVVFTQFRPVITGAAQQVGSTFADIFTQPIPAAIAQVSENLGDLPDIQLKLPSIDLTGGLFKFTQEQLPRDIGGETAPLDGGSTVTFAPNTQFDPNTGIIEGSPPQLNLLPEAFGSVLTRINRVFNVTGAGRRTTEQVLDIAPQAVGLFDVLTTPQTEFLPFSEAGVRASVEAGQGLRLSGQLFQEIRNVQDIVGVA